MPGATGSPTTAPRPIAGSGAGAPSPSRRRRRVCRVRSSRPWCATRRLASLYGHPVDLEWANDGTATWWLQVRPMTGLAGLRIYSNRIARDVLPG